MQENADQLRMQLDQQQKAVDQLLSNTRMLEGKLAEAKSKKDTLKARAASAKTSKQIQEMIGSLNTSNAVVAFEKMEEKVSAMCQGYMHAYMHTMIHGECNAYLMNSHWLISRLLSHVPLMFVSVCAPTCVCVCGVCAGHVNGG